MASTQTITRSFTKTSDLIEKRSTFGTLCVVNIKFETRTSNRLLYFTNKSYDIIVFNLMNMCHKIH